MLIDAGYDPTTPLHCYRGETLCLIVASIGEAATLEPNSNGTGFVRWRARVRAASPIAPLAEPYGKGVLAPPVAPLAAGAP